MKKLLELREILVNVQSYSWKDSLFIAMTEKWSLESICAVLNVDELEEDEETPSFAINNNLTYVLTIQEVQDVVKNINEQSPECTDDELLRAVHYYYQNDAFIVL